MLINTPSFKWLLAILLVLYGLPDFAQTCEGKKSNANVINDGDFEQFKTTCLNDIGSLLEGGNAGPQSWNALGNVDNLSYYMNTCSGSGTYHPTNNLYGTQAPHSGNGYLTLVCGPSPLTEPAERFFGYVTQTFNKPLLKGVTYYIEFYVSLAEQSRNGVNSLGIYFTNDEGDIDPNVHSDLTHLTPQVPNEFPSANPYIDYTGWTKICGQFTPQVDGVKHMAIGNFRTNYFASNTPGYNGSFTSRPVYYIDDIYISEYVCCPSDAAFQNTSSLPSSTEVRTTITAGNFITPAPPGNVNILAGQNVVFKAQEQIILKSGFNANTGSTFLAKIGSCTGSNHLDVNIIFTPISFSTYSLTAQATNGSGNYTYHWNNGQTTQTIVLGYGVHYYSVVVTDNVALGEEEPCDLKIGWADYQDPCPICRPSSMMDIENSASSAQDAALSPAETLVVFPNPSNGLFTITATSEVVRYVIHDPYGEIIQDTPKSATIGQTWQLNMTGKNKGVYVLRLFWSNNTTSTRLLVVN